MLPNNALENLIHAYLAGGHIPPESHPVMDSSCIG